MGPKVGRKRSHHGIRDVKRSKKTKAKTRDLDEIFDDIESPQKLLNQPVNPDLPGQGQFYCIHCARHFITNEALQTHISGKLHKKRVKVLKTETKYTQKEAELAAGLKTDNGPGRN
ncbi:hypothetical protein HDV01_001359 [Terramyces sp. JEL0728]|nr:hypothetical protein HDV01_001359 [Terramyces sp. JEL0728]